LPNSPINSFRFNSSSASFARAEVELQLEALEIRIENIVKKFTIEGNPILGLILQLTHDQEELAGLAKGLGRLADLIGPYDELQQRKQLLDIAEKDPNWLAWAFGDFDEEINETIKKFFSVDES